jgi:5-methylcytosine-specific restriction endonuclease McrA
MIATANPIPSSAAASHHVATSHSLELFEARQARDGLATLLRAERNAAAEFLLALSDFDRRRGWERLGHASLFAFLHVELGLSKGAAYVRFTAARLLQAFPEVIEPIRSGRLCLSAVGELARVATPVNFSVVLPRFFGCSSREAREVAAAALPRPAPSLRDQITRLQPAVELRSPAPSGRPEPQASPELPAQATPLELATPADAVAVRAHELALTHPARAVERRDEVEPLTADLRRLHITVDAQFLKMLDTARDGLSHSIPGASMEQVLKAALEILLEKQARARGLVKKPRKSVGTSAATATPKETPIPDFIDPPHRRTGPRQAIPAAVRRAVWARDGGRCSWPLDGGGVCGSTHRLEFDHIVPWARWGGETVDDLRVTCHPHNALAARAAFGDRCMDRYAPARRPRTAW